MLGFDICWNTRISATRSTGCTCISRVYWVGGIQPEHVGIVIIPEGHDQDNTCIHRLLHGSQATLLKEICTILSLCHPIFAEVICDGLMLVPIDSVGRMFNSFSILGVEL